MEVYLIMGMAVLIYSFVALFRNSDYWNPEFHQKCRCEKCGSLCQNANGAKTPFVLSVSSYINDIELP